MAAGAAPAATAARDKRGESYRKPPPEKNWRRYSASPAMLKFFLTFVLIATITFPLVAQTPKPEATQYTCVMHPEVVQDHPGKCPECGMELVPIKKSNAKHSTKLETVDSTAREPMHHHHMEERHATHEMKMQSSVIWPIRWRVKGRAQVGCQIPHRC